MSDPEGNTNGDEDPETSTVVEKAKECENEDWPPEDEDEVEKERSEERKRAEDWKKTVGGSRDFYYFMLRASMIRAEIRAEGLLGCCLRRNLLCLEWSETYTALLVDYFNSIFPRISVQIAAIEESLIFFYGKKESPNKSVAQIDKDILEANLHCLERLMMLLGGKTLRDVINRMKVVFQNNDIKLLRDATQQARNVSDKLFKLLQAYFKLGVNLGLPEAKSIVVFSVSVERFKNSADMTATKAYEVLQKFDKMASGGIETSSNRETLTLLDRLFKNKPPSDPVSDEVTRACDFIDGCTEEQISAFYKKEWESKAGFGAWFAKKELGG